MKFFLFLTLSLKFSPMELRVVKVVIVLGCLQQIFLFMCLCGITASLSGCKSLKGVFAGTFLSMSSTIVDYVVGLLFTLLPVLG